MDHVPERFLIQNFTLAPSLMLAHRQAMISILHWYAGIRRLSEWSVLCSLSSTFLHAHPEIDKNLVTQSGIE